MTKIDVSDLLASGEDLEFLVMLDNAKPMETPRAAVSDSDWPDLVPLKEYSLPTFPAEALPDWLRDFVLAVAEATQTPVALPGMLALTTLAAACGGAFKVRVRDGYQEPLNLFAVVVLDPANRKSAVFRAVVSPLEMFEAELVAAAGPEIERSKSELRIKEAARKHVEHAAARGKAAERADAMSEAQELSVELDELKVPAVPRLIADDVTSEKVAQLLHEQGGRLAVMSAEGGVFEILAGRYQQSAGPNFDVFLKGHSGDALRIDRIGRSSEFVDSPALTVGLAVQSDVLRTLSDKPGFRGRGLLARFMYSIPESLIGRRCVSPPSVPPVVRDAYHGHFKEILGSIQSRRPEVGELFLSEEALALWTEFSELIEPRLGKHGDLSVVADWAGKLCGAVARLAALLHLADTLTSEPGNCAVGAGHMGSAIELGKYLIPHAQLAFAEMGADPLLTDAIDVAEWLGYKQIPAFTKRDIHQAHRSRFKSADEIDPVLELLASHSYIRVVEVPEEKKPGRKPSPKYETHPLVLAGTQQVTQITHITQNPSPAESPEEIDPWA